MPEVEIDLSNLDRDIDYIIMEMNYSANVMVHTYINIAGHKLYLSSKEAVWTLGSTQYQYLQHAFLCLNLPKTMKAAFMGYAIRLIHVDLIKLILKHTTDFDTKTLIKYFRLCFQWISHTEICGIIDSFMDAGLSAICVTEEAVYHSCEGVLEYLCIKNIAVLDYESGQFCNAEWFKDTLANSEGLMVRWVIEHYLATNPDKTVNSLMQENVLQHVVEYANDNVCDVLIDYGLDVHLYDNFLWREALALGRCEFVKLLIPYHLDIIEANDNVAFRSAVVHDDPILCNLLLSKGACSSNPETLKNIKRSWEIEQKRKVLDSDICRTPYFLINDDLKVVFDIYISNTDTDRTVLFDMCQKIISQGDSPSEIDLTRPLSNFFRNRDLFSWNEIFINQLYITVCDVKILLDCPPTPQTSQTLCQTVSSIIGDAEFSQNAKDLLLIFGSNKNIPDLVRLMIQYGACVNVCDDIAIHSAVGTAEPSRMEIVKMLLNAGGSAHVALETALNTCSIENDKLIKYLLVNHVYGIDSTTPGIVPYKWLLHKSTAAIIINHFLSLNPRKTINDLVPGDIFSHYDLCKRQVRYTLNMNATGYIVLLRHHIEFLAYDDKIWYESCRRGYYYVALALLPYHRDTIESDNNCAIRTVLENFLNMTDKNPFFDGGWGDVRFAEILLEQMFAAGACASNLADMHDVVRLWFHPDVQLSAETIWKIPFYMSIIKFRINAIIDRYATKLLGPHYL